MRPVISSLVALLGVDNVLVGDAISHDYAHDESLSGEHHVPLAVAIPSGVDHVRRLLVWATENRVPVTARGAGTGLSGACVPKANGIVVSFERMKRILEIDTDNHVAVVEPGVSLEDLNASAAERGLVYPVFPGENSATLGGNVA